jgi:hypothetical protein
LKACSNKNVNIFIAGRRDKNQKIGIRIDTKTYYHVLLFILFGKEESTKK